MSTIVRCFISTLVGGLLFASVTAPSWAGLDNDEVDITFIIYTGPNIYWDPVLNGAKEAAEHLGANIDIQFANEDPVTQNNIIETAIANRVDGIAVANFVEGAFVESTCAAREEGMGVVVFNIDSRDTCGQAFIGQDFFILGENVAQHLIDNAGLKSGDHVFLPVEFPEGIYAIELLEGARRAFDPAGITSEMVGCGVELDGCQTRVGEYLVGHPETDAVMSLGGTPTIVVPQAMEEAGMDLLPNSGMDVHPEVVQAILDGRTIATGDSGVWYQGYMTVTQLVFFAKYAIPPADMLVGIDVIDKSTAAVTREWAGKTR